MKQTVLDNYQQFSAAFTDTSNKYSKLIDDEVKGLKMSVKESLRKNLKQFEIAKLEFENTIAPMLLHEFHERINATWMGRM